MNHRNRFWSCPALREDKATMTFERLPATLLASVATPRSTKGCRSELYTILATAQGEPK